MERSGEQTVSTAGQRPAQASTSPRSGASCPPIVDTGIGELARPRPTAAVGRRALVVELFGPPAAGKTTLARALGATLDARGFAACITSSARPAEQWRCHGESSTQSRSALAAPLARASKLIGALGVLMPGAPVDPLVRQLMQLLPPGSRIRTLRARRYLARLCRSWGAARASGEVMVFDQGFLTALCSLALLAGPIDRSALARGLELIPEPDLLVRIDTPREVLEARLRKRLGRQSALERFFENDAEVSLRQIELCSILDGLLRERGQHSMRVSWPDRSGLASVANAIGDEIILRGGGPTA